VGQIPNPKKGPNIAPEADAAGKLAAGRLSASLALIPLRQREMAFPTERTGYKKTILSDLQGAWTLLRESVVDTKGFDGWDRVLFNIDEAMSWETVRNLDRMPPLLLVIRNLCYQRKAPGEVMENIEEVNDILKEVLEEYRK